MSITNCFTKKWNSVTIKEITNNLDNKRIPLNDVQRNEKRGSSKYPYYGANGIVDWIDDYIFDDKILCLAEDGGDWGKNKKCSFIVNEKCWVNNHAHVLTAKNNLHIEYLMYYLNYTDLNWAITGTTRGKLTQGALNSIKIPLPPLDVQKKIAVVLDKADHLRQKRREAIEKLDLLVQSVFLDMFGDPVSNPKGWAIVKVIDVCDCIVPGRDKPKSFTGEIPWVTTEDLNPSGLTMESTKKLGLTKEEIKQVKAKIVPQKSVLMTCVGNLGVISIAGRDMVINQQLHAFQCNSKINNEYLRYVLGFKTDYMYKMATLTTVPYMNKTVCNSIPILLPPIELQNEFAEKIQKTEIVKEKFKRTQNKLDTLFNSLIQRAFRGELSFNDRAFSDMEEAVS